MTLYIIITFPSRYFLLVWCKMAVLSHSTMRILIFENLSIKWKKAKSCVLSCSNLYFKFMIQFLKIFDKVEKVLWLYLWPFVCLIFENIFRMTWNFCLLFMHILRGFELKGNIWLIVPIKGHTHEIRFTTDVRQ